MVLIPPENAPQKSAEEILGLDRIDLPLITLPQGEPAVLAFQEELQKRKIEWYPMLELASLDLVARFVSGGHGAGLVFDNPGSPQPPGLKTLELPGFPEIPFFALTAGVRPPMADRVIHEAERVISSMQTGVPC